MLVGMAKRCEGGGRDWVTKGPEELQCDLSGFRTSAMLLRIPKLNPIPITFVRCNIRVRSSDYQGFQRTSITQRVHIHYLWN